MVERRKPVVSFFGFYLITPDPWAAFPVYILLMMMGPHYSAKLARVSKCYLVILISELSVMLGAGTSIKGQVPGLFYSVVFMNL